MRDEPPAPGWQAIEDAVRRHYSGVEPIHYANMTALPGQDGLYGLNAYPVAGRWLLVTLGLTELFDKVSDDPDTSGWGIELTLLVNGPGDAPPAWALRLLEKLAAYVDASARPFASGHRMDPGGPITGNPGDPHTALAFTVDPQLGSIETPHGTVDFLRVVGITADELATAKASSTDELLTRILDHNPDLATDTAR